ncbi:hypothetical protein [Streptomyces candidus]|uniref:Secreted protein n=1 Tax=Streptomyces candidus TaxID=67283 RepID=A0A7X0HI04_9ACTN|nr:hypothetical protein [Streptomyces candidus]MBB6437981.1 hypothetical protein [Streptomyces candidus]GHH39760.1 hypothetical protein GCM10018773_20180 [Streptomyces candidus]
MPRGRHRHSPPLHKLLPSSAVAGGSLACAVGAWFVAEPVALRVLVAVVAAAAVTGAVLMRSWDRTAGRRVAELKRAREADTWKTEERVAEIEGDLEESRALRVKLEARLRAKRAELAALRNEHAALLRRYATAETERATALERRRLLELTAAAEERPKELPAARSTPTPAAYMRAAAALENLERNGRAQREAAARVASGGMAVRPAAQVPARVAAPRDATGDTPADVPADGQVPVREEARVDAQALAPVPASGAARPPASAPPGASVPAAAPSAGPVPAATPRPAPDAAREAREHTRPSSALTPYAPQNLPAVRKQGGFDFFGTSTGAGVAADMQDEDLADVVGEEALAEHRSSRTAADAETVGAVIDLTAHDETEQLDVADLRSAIGS